MEKSFLTQAMVYMTAAVVCVPVAKRLGLGSVLGYLIAGVCIGPFLLGFIGQEGKDIMHFAEFGVVMMLFLVGLELEPAKLWQARKDILGIGLSQVAVTTLAVAAVGIAVGISWQTSLAVGMAFSMSSTAIVLQSLKEKGQMNTAAGKNSFSVLLFQDIAVIPMLALLPLLATAPQQSAGEAHGSVLETLPGWVQTLAVLGAVAAVIVLGRYAIVPLLRIVARTHLRELFTASALLIVVSIASLMQLVGLSPALGTFLAGVILANSEFRHELESDLDPFKGLLLGLFFMAVGASINFALIGEQPLLIISLTLGTLLLKTTVLWLLGKRAQMSVGQNLTFSLGLSQVGEFAFVLLAFIGQLGILTDADANLLMAVTALTMVTTPLLNMLNDRVLLPRTIHPESSGKSADTIEEQHKIIIVGFGHYGNTLGRFLRANGIEATILDHDSDRVELLRKMGFKVYYGNATRVDLLEAAGAAEARLLICAIDSPETTLELVEIMQKHFPKTELIVRAKNRYDAYELMDLGITNIYREHLESSVRMGVDVLHKLGFRYYSAMRSGQDFIRYDEASLWKLAEHRHNATNYITNVKEQIALIEELLKNDMQKAPNLSDHAWDSEQMREMITQQRKDA